LAISQSDSTSLPFDSISEPSDHSLIEAFRTGDLDAATQLYERYTRRLLKLAEGKFPPGINRQIDPEDVVQSVFRSFFRQARKGLYDVPSGSDLWPLLLVVAMNKIRAYGVFHRAAKRDIRRTQSLTHSDAVAKAADSLQQSDSQPFLQMVAIELLEKLPPVQKSIVELRLEGYQVAEIASRLNRTKRTVERLLSDCRRRLQESLDAEKVDEG
jgi:RNA polymerase sigma-70 factor, ECF subfamily